MDDIIRKLTKAWEMAADDLGIEVVLPYMLRSSKGQEAEYVALVRDFGSDKGMLVLASSDSEKMKLAEDAGFGFSCMLSPFYRDYDRSLFTELLTDWGWTGIPEDKPEWYVRIGELEDNSHID
jgi:hypothetical protein